MRDRDLSPGVPCVINGLVGQVSVQAVDFSILAIAVVTLLTVTRTTFMPDVSRITKIFVCLSVWVIPVSTGLTATAMGAMSPVGTNWCWITAARPDLRYALTHGWRFAVIFGTIAIYLYIWFYLRNHFRSVGIALKTGWSQLSADGQQVDNKSGAGGGMGLSQGLDGFGEAKEGAAFAGTLEHRQRKQSMAQGRADASAHLTVPRAAARRDSLAMYGRSFYNDNRSSLGEVEEDREGLLSPIEREKLTDVEWAREQKLKLQTKGGKGPVVSWNLPRIPNTPLVSRPNTPSSPSGNNLIKIGFAISSDSPQTHPLTVRGRPGGDAADTLAVPGGRLERPERAHKRSSSDASGLVDSSLGAQNHKRSTSDSSMATDDSRASVGAYSLFPNAKTSASRRSVLADDFTSSVPQQQQQQQQDRQTKKDDGGKWPSATPRKSRAPPPPRPTTNISEFPMRQEKRKVDREVQRMLLLNAYPILYVILWIPGIINRLMEAAGHPVTGRAAQALQSSSQFIGLANALTYGFNRHIRHRITGDLLSKLRAGKVTEIVSR